MSWTSAEVMELTGATYRQIDYWSRCGIFGDLVAHPGSGYERRFTVDQLWRAHVLVAAYRAGIKQRTVIDVLDRMGFADTPTVLIRLTDQAVVAITIPWVPISEETDSYASGA